MHPAVSVNAPAVANDDEVSDLVVVKLRVIEFARAGMLLMQFPTKDRRFRFELEMPSRGVCIGCSFTISSLPFGFAGMIGFSLRCRE